jgi:hypothetical protein
VGSTKFAMYFSRIFVHTLQWGRNIRKDLGCGLSRVVGIASGIRFPEGYPSPE